jgi:hypothetical protein
MRGTNQRAGWALAIMKESDCPEEYHPVRIHEIVPRNLQDI